MYSKYDISKHLLRQIVSVIYLTMMQHLETEYFCAKDCLASRDEIKIPLKIPRRSLRNVSIIANWKVIL